MSKKLREYYRERKKNWWNIFDFKEAQDQHALNLKALEAVMKWRENEERPISVLLVHGSGRHPELSCAHELPNSQMLLERGLELVQEEFGGDPTSPDLDVNRLTLREMYIEPCNNCVSTASALCGFSCDCWPGDDMTVQAYPMILWADVIFFSSGVNQSMVSSRTKMFLDRMISIDGGYYRRQIEPKNADFRERMIRLSQEKPVYDQRLFGKIAGYVLTSKDILNTMDDGIDVGTLNYEQLVTGAMKSSMGDYGFFHANKWYVMAGANPDEDYSKDKDFYNSDTKTHEETKEMILSSLELAQQYREKPPTYGGGARVNRT